jgi:N-acetylmuramoyl-L-alanine amidase
MTDLKSLRFPGAKYQGRNSNSSGSFARGRPVGIVLHYTAGGAAVDRLSGKGDSNVSCHFTVDRNGEIYQCADLDQRCWHAGVSTYGGMVGLNDYFLGIEQANYGYWDKDERRLGPLQEYIDAGWIKAQHKDGRGGRALLGAVRREAPGLDREAICRWLLKEIPTIRTIQGHDDVSPKFRKKDPGPAFPIQRFRSLLMPDDMPQSHRATKSSQVRLPQCT